MRPKPGGGGAVSMEGDAEPEIEDVVLVACIDRRPALLQVSITAPVEVGDRRERDVPADPDGILRTDYEAEPVRCRGAGGAVSAAAVSLAVLEVQARYPSMLTVRRRHHVTERYHD